LKIKGFFYFFYFPFLGIVVLFFALSTLNRNYIKNKTEQLVQEQLKATAGILKTHISHLLVENYPKENIFSLFAGEDKIYFMALLDEKYNIIDWSSRYEGYLPISIKNGMDESSWIIDSPVGNIFNIFTFFTTEKKENYYLYLGYSLNPLEKMLVRSKQNFFFIISLFVVIGVIFFWGLYKIQSHYLERTREVEKVQKEKERFKEISAFTSGVAHEIKNPLNRLSLLMELLHKTENPSEIKEKTRIGKYEIQNISRIIDQFSSSLKPLKLNKEKTDLNDIINPVIESALKQTKKAITIRFPSFKPIPLTVDKNLLSQALFNLIQNSIEATDNGEISVEANRQKKKIKISIKDPGHGISKSDAEKIFKPFFSRKKQGMGIGLFLTNKIIEAHNGKLTFESEPGKGSIFSIMLTGV
jgi:signal transduction histidine kinase